jgi:SAM-dependent methyltransferase
MAERGAKVTGVDFSPIAIAHAESLVSSIKSGPDYLVADYLKDELPTGFDVVTLIYYDYCALSPADRYALLHRIHSMLNPGGTLVLDVLTDSVFPHISEQLSIEERSMDGFWSESDYVGVHRTWLYQDRMVSLDHYAILEPSTCWQILNWMQYFSTNRLGQELEQTGYVIRKLTGSLAGESLTDASKEIGVIAEARSTGQRA